MAEPMGGELRAETDAQRRHSDVQQEMELLRKPGAPHEPVRVYATVLLKDVGNVGLLASTFMAMVGIRLHWIDERFAEGKGADSRGDDHLPTLLWCPALSLPNALDIEPSAFFVRSDGVNVLSRQTGLLTFYHNVTAQFKGNFDLSDFPHETVCLDVRMNSAFLRDGRPATQLDANGKAIPQFELMPGVSPRETPGCPHSHGVL